MSDVIDLLVTLDQAYLPRLQVVVASMHATNPGERFRLHLLHQGIPEDELRRFERCIEPLGYELEAQEVDEGLFSGAPTQKRYPAQMYYRLLAGHLLPESVRRVLYLDPDVLVINPLRPLWETDLQGHAFAAAAHEALPVSDLTENVNNVRLGTRGCYFNSGVLLIDLRAARRVVCPADVFAYAQEHAKTLLLPDQDILNALYSTEILEVDELVWNYDASTFHAYLIDSQGEADVEWVMEHTAVLHFCGRAKPWKPNYRYRFGVLYKHYERQAARIFG